MLECNVILTSFAHSICLHGYIHFNDSFNPNTKYREHTTNHPKNPDMIVSHIAQPYFEETCIW